MRMLSSKGMSTAVVLVGLVVLAVLVLGSWFVWHKSNARTMSERVDSNSKEVVPGGESGKQVSKEVAAEVAAETWVTYKNPDARLMFSYPESWRHAPTEATVYDGNPETVSVSGVLTAPSGKELKWVYQTIGGRGGECQPEADDTSFALKGNQCSSKQVYSSDMFKSSGPDTELFNSRNVFVITETKAAHPGESITYQVCLDRVFSDDIKRTEPGIRMGLLFPCEFWSSGFNAVFQVNGESDFKSAEVKVVKEIMHTFNSY